MRYYQVIGSIFMQFNQSLLITMRAICQQSKYRIHYFQAANENETKSDKYYRSIISLHLEMWPLGSTYQASDMEWVLWLRYGQFKVLRSINFRIDSNDHTMWVKKETTKEIIHEHSTWLCPHDVNLSNCDYQ